MAHASTMTPGSCAAARNGWRQASTISSPTGTMIAARSHNAAIQHPVDNAAPQAGTDRDRQPWTNCFPWPLLAQIIAASSLLAVTPDQCPYIVTRSSAPGRRAGSASVAGIALGNLGNAIGAQPLAPPRCSRCRRIAFTLVKYAGSIAHSWHHILRTWPGTTAVRNHDAASRGYLFDGWSSRC